MANHKKVETAAKLKKFYSTMSNAVKLAETEWGISSYEWDSYSSANNGIFNWYSNYLLKYISYSAVKKLSETGSYYEQIDTTYKEIAPDVPVIYLNDGSLFFPDEVAEEIIYDVNGEKGPNKMGRDLFNFYILNGEDPDYSVNDSMAHFNTIGCNTLSYMFFSLENMKSTCSKTGYYCSYLIEANGWEIPDDYPKKL